MNGDGNDSRSTKSFRLGYSPALDGIRGVAILAVMAEHIGIAQIKGLWLGVDAFFVLSGFLITTLLLQEWQVKGRIDFRNFYARRFLRLSPAFVLMLGVIALLSATYFTEPYASSVFRGIPWAFFYVINIGMLFNWIGPNNALVLMWSLACEEQFYLIWPPVVALLLRRRKTPLALARIILLVMIVPIVLRLILWSAGSLPEHVRYNLFTRPDGLLAGCVVAFLAASGSLARCARYIPAVIVSSFIALALMLPLFLAREESLFAIGLPVFAVAVAAVTAGVVTESSSLLMRLITVVLRISLLVWIGRISYGLYLWHVVAYRIAVEVLQDRPVGVGRDIQMVLLKLSLSFLMAAASFYLYERQFLRLKSRFR